MILLMLLTLRGIVIINKIKEIALVILISRTLSAISVERKDIIRVSVLSRRKNLRIKMIRHA